MWCKTSPLGVSVIHDVEFAFAKCVPQLDRPVSRSGNNLTIIGGERDPATMGKPLSTGSATARQNIDPDSMGIAARWNSRQHIPSMSHKLLGRQSRVEIPQPQRLVPWWGEGELTVRGDDDVGYEMVVTVEDFLRETESGVVSGELPDDDGFVWKARHMSQHEDR